MVPFLPLAVVLQIGYSAAVHAAGTVLVFSLILHVSFHATHIAISVPTQNQAVEDASRALPPLNISPADQIMSKHLLPKPVGRAPRARRKQNRQVPQSGRARSSSAPQASYNAANFCRANPNPSLADSSSNFSALLRFSSPPCFMYQSARPHFNARDGCFSSTNNHHPMSP